MPTDWAFTNNATPEADMELAQLQELTQEWASVRNFMNGSSPLLQMKKLREEIGETMYANLIPSFEKERDGLGDTTVVLCIQAWQLGFSYLDCLKAGRSAIQDVKVEGTVTLFMFGQIVQAAERIGNALEAGECQGALDNIGECAAWVHRRAEQIGSNLSQCWEEAYLEIKDRQGEMVGGVWVKAA